MSTDWTKWITWQLLNWWKMLPCSLPVLFYPVNNQITITWKYHAIYVVTWYNSTCTRGTIPISYWQLLPAHFQVIVPLLALLKRGIAPHILTHIMVQCKCIRPYFVVAVRASSITLCLLAVGSFWVFGTCWILETWPFEEYL